MLKQPQPYSAPIKVLYYDDEGKQITDEKYLHEKQVTKNPDDTRTAQPEGGLAVVGRLAAQKNDQAWEALSSSFFQTVQHQITKKLPGAHSHFKKDIWSGSLKSRADFFDGEYVVEFVVAKSSILTLKLSEGLGKLCLIDKMLPKSKPKMLVVCTNIDRPQTNPKLLDDQSTARAMGIELLFVSHFDEVMAAEAVIAFISRPNTQD